MAGEEFGAGIEVPGTPVVQQQVVPPVQIPSVSRALAEQLATAGLNVPEDWNDQTIADNLVAMQERADKAAEYQTRIQQFEEREAQAAAQVAAAAAQKKPDETAAQAAARRKYEKVIIDQDAMNFVERDPVNGGFKPKDPRSGLHVQAANVVNEAISRRSRVSNDIVDDPYGTAAELVAPLLEERDRLWEERIKAIEAKFTPVEAQMASAAQAQAESAFVAANNAKLFSAPDVYTPVGQMVASLYYDEKIPLERALAIAEKALGEPAAPAAPPKSKSISKVAQPQEPALDRRFVAGVHPNRLQNLPDSGAPPTGQMNSFNDFYKKHPIARPGYRSN